VEGIGNFLGDIAAASGTASSENVFAALPEYSTVGVGSGDQVAAYRSTYLGRADITPSTGTQVSQDEIKATIDAQIEAGKLPLPTDATAGPETIYVLLLPPNIEACVESNCSGTANSHSLFCSFHGSGSYQGAKYAFVASLTLSGELEQGCGGSPPNRLDKETSVLTHELTDAITDPLIEEEMLGWYDKNNGEIAIICNAENAEERINGHLWTVQKIWSQAENACVAGDSLFSQPTADFTATPSQNNAAFAASGTSTNHLTSISAGIVSYSWDFGDGQSATGQNPTHAYAAAGTYTVNLTATDSLGFTAHASHQVTVSAPPSSNTNTGSAPSTGGSGNTGPSAGLPASVSSSGGASTSSAGTVITGETVSCPPQGGLCVATVLGEVETAHLASAANKHKVKNSKLRVASATITISPGASAKVTFKLNATGKSLLHTHGHLLIKLTVTIRHGSDAPVISTHEIRINAPKRRSSRKR
jgi:hypothetical protein